MKGFAEKLLLASFILLASCATEDKLPGTRENIFNMEEQSEAENALNPVQLSSLVPADDWLVESKNSVHTCDNLMFSNVGELKKDWSFNISSFPKSFEYVSTPVVYGDVIYVLNKNAVLFALNLKTGEKVYKKSLIDLDDDKVSRINYFAGLAFDAKSNLLFAVLGNGKVFALKPENADVIWEADLKQPVKSAPNFSDDNLFIATVNNAIVALNKDSGNSSFVVNTVPQMTAFSKGSVPAVYDGVVSVGFSNNEVYFVEEKTGSVIYALSLFGYGSSLLGSPIVDVISNVVIDTEKNIAFANNTEGAFKAVKLPKAPDFKSEVIWSIKNGSYSTACANGNALFMANNQNQLLALDKNTGKIIWSFDLKQLYESKNRIFNTLGIVLANGDLVISNSLGDLIFVKADSGEFVRKINVSDKLVSAPVVVKDRIIILDSDGDVLSYMFK